VEWFLAQQGEVKGFTRAIYTGFPTVELARIIAEYVLPEPSLKGLYHVAADPINKYELLKLVAHTYGKQIQIRPDDQFFCDRSLNGRKFADATGYQALTWPELVRRMHAHFVSSSFYRKPVTS
jgi:dTDP-4-dehydrorhamnose reductase